MGAEGAKPGPAPLMMGVGIAQTVCLVGMLVWLVVRAPVEDDRARSGGPGVDAAARA